MGRDRGALAGLALVVCLVSLGADAAMARAARPHVVLPPALRASASACLAATLGLCPDMLAGKDHGAACLVRRRREIGRLCRGVSQGGLKLLRH